MYVILVSTLINIIILTGRIEDLGIKGFIESIFLRRYFFDVEKVSLIFEYSKLTCGQEFNLLYFCIDNFNIPGNIHRFIGEDIIGISNLGVPPNIVGEIILRLGPLALFIIAPLLGVTIMLL